MLKMFASILGITLLGLGSTITIARASDIKVTVDLPAQISAVVARTPSCQNLKPFALEIGRAARADFKMEFGLKAPKEDQPLRIASATKWIGAAYFLEQSGSQLDETTTRGLRLLSGRVSFNGCEREPTVERCFRLGRNSMVTNREIGFFNYGSGHFASLAMDFGLGPLNVKGLAQEVQRALGIPEIEFTAPNLAAGGLVTTRAYAQFLRKILEGKLRISAFLGADRVCTLPGECASARSTVVQQNFGYSYGHWVERTPRGSGDGVFSSVGMWGFYPWIHPLLSNYGLISAQSTNPQAYLLALRCGAEIRKVL